MSRPTVKNWAAIVLLLIAALAVWFWLKPSEPAPVPPIQSGPSISVIGRSVEQRDIQAYAFGSGSKHLLFVGGIHGGYEWNTVLLAYQFINYLTANPSAVPKDLTVTVIPDLNPDGVYAVTGKTGEFAVADVNNSLPTGTGRFNDHGVDLNRNFACNWQPESTWRNNKVSAGTAPFSEPEAAALRDFILRDQPAAVVFWHSQSNAVYASYCNDGVSTGTAALMNAYAQAAGYKADSSFSSYAITGDADGWLASIGIPTVSVELATHETVEWNKNLSGIKAVLSSYSALGR